jgi:DNA-binding MarR family transcriptional regulator
MNEFLKLDNQLCFKIYASHRKMTKEYKPLLDKLNLTYPQYLVMLVLWEKSPITVKELGEKLYLDSGTISPLIKNLEAKGFIKKQRDTEDERVVYVNLTVEGISLKDSALEVPKMMTEKGLVDYEEYEVLMKILNKFMEEES